MKAIVGDAAVLSSLKLLAVEDYLRKRVGSLLPYWTDALGDRPSYSFV